MSLYGLEADFLDVALLSLAHSISSYRTCCC